jgi:hypothetical protein
MPEPVFFASNHRAIAAWDGQVRQFDFDSARVVVKSFSHVANVGTMGEACRKPYGFYRKTK